MSTIKNLRALEILDSRGRPTVKAWCELESGAMGAASVPSGASTGRAEAWELRDGDASRYRGLGCRRAVGNITGEIAKRIVASTFQTQQKLDALLCELDGTSNKSRLGANAILAVSLAFARAMAKQQAVPLYQYFADLRGGEIKTLPRPTINLWSGGKHAGGQVPIQDVLLVPQRAPTMDEALATVYAVYQAAAELSQEKYGTRALTADEGGLAPPFPDAETMLQDAVAAIERAGFEAGNDVALAVDVASSHFYRDGNYYLHENPLSADEMISQLIEWKNRFPIISIEDGLSEEDWPAWSKLRARLASTLNAEKRDESTSSKDESTCSEISRAENVLAENVLVLGDDFLCTNPARIGRAIETNSANALLLKVNQIGTLSEAAAADELARSAKWRVVVSARSGETEDNWLADLAVGWSGDYIKIGSITQSERLAKYNRLLEIEAETSLSLAG